MNKLVDKIALVTGAAKNLGRAIAVDLAKQGVKIVIHYNTSEQEAKRTLNEVKKYVDGIAVQADLTQQENVEAMFQSINNKLGKIDILINLIGNFIYEPISATSFEKFRDVIESNLYSAFLCCQAALPSMQKKGWGRIVNFGAVGADNLMIREKTTPYYIAKAGVLMLTKVMAYQYAPSGVTINSISPGILTTSIVKTATPTGRYAQFQDIINAIHFLLQDESNYINGANLEVAGGWRPGFASSIPSPHGCAAHPWGGFEATLGNTE